MKVMLLLIASLAFLIWLAIRVMARSDPGWFRRYLKFENDETKDPHRGYPVKPLSREEIVRREPIHSSSGPMPDSPTSPDLNTMRLGMQKIAYEMVGDKNSPETKARFKRDMTEFASLDPLVHLIAKRVHELAIDNPGQLQSKIYRHFPEFDKEQVRYGLYFADELGWIRRKKKGNTYQLFPAGGTYDE